MRSGTSRRRRSRSKAFLPNGPLMTAPTQQGSGPPGPSPQDLPHLRRCVELAAEAVAAGDFPFGSVLVAEDGRGLAADRNPGSTMGRPTPHPGVGLAPP